jgi:hypothetical protein
VIDGTATEGLVGILTNARDKKRKVEVDVEKAAVSARVAMAASQRRRQSRAQAEKSSTKSVYDSATFVREVSAVVDNFSDFARAAAAALDHWVGRTTPDRETGDFEIGTLFPADDVKCLAFELVPGDTGYFIEETDATTVFLQCVAIVDKDVDVVVGVQLFTDRHQSGFGIPVLDRILVPAEFVSHLGDLFPSGVSFPYYVVKTLTPERVQLDSIEAVVDSGDLVSFPPAKKAKVASDDDDDNDDDDDEAYVHKTLVDYGSDQDSDDE